MKFEFFMFTGGFLGFIQIPFLSIGFGLGVWTYLDWQVLSILFKGGIHVLKTNVIQCYIPFYFNVLQYNNGIQYFSAQI